MRKICIRDKGLVGTLFQPELQLPAKLPGLILLPGSEGGIPEVFAEKLASAGYCVLALGYFGVEGMPQSLENIHLNYFRQALLWLKNQPQIRGNSIGLIGYSRGAELALLLGSIHPDLINTLVAYVPSSVVCGGFPYPNRPAWLHKNKPITPFLSGLSSDNRDLTEGDDLMLATQSGKIPYHENTAQDPYAISELFLARNRQDNLLETAAIPVENICCPLLILSGDADEIWPSALYGKLIMERLDQKKSPIQRQHLCYPEVGHGLVAPYDEPVYHPVGRFWCRLGGDPKKNAEACESSWYAVLKFLEGALGLFRKA